MKRPSHTTPRYVCAQVKKLLVLQGLPVAKRSGRYSPFGSTVVVTEGYRVNRVGVSLKVAVSYEAAHRNGRSFDLPRDVRAAKDAEAWALLRARGYDVDAIGYITCEYES